MAVNKYQLYQSVPSREGAGLFTAGSPQTKHLANPYPLVGSLFGIPSPLYIRQPPKSDFQKKQLIAGESSLLKECKATNYLERGLKKGGKSRPNPDSESTQLQAKRIKQNRKNKHSAKDLLCF